MTAPTPLPFGLAVVLALLPAASSPAADWPMAGRVNSRNAVSPEKGAPLRWSVEPGKRSGVKWEADLGTRCICSPVVSSGLVWVGTNNGRPRDSKATKDAAVLMCFREADGKFLWQYASPRLEDQHQDFPNASLNCSPLVEGARLYFTTNRCEVACLSIRPLLEGKGEPFPIWKLDLRKEFGVCPKGPECPGIGFTCSIGASYQGRLYVTTGNGVGEDQKTVPAPDAPSLLCLEKDTGKVLWKDASPGKNILHSQWGSPLLVEGRSGAQVVVGQGDGWVRSFDAVSGQLLWKFDTNAKADDWKMNGTGTRNHLPAIPVLNDGRVYVAGGRAEVDGLGLGRLWCVEPAWGTPKQVRDLTPTWDDSGPRPAAARAPGLRWHHGGKIIPRPKKGRELLFGRTLSSVAVHDGLVLAPELDGYVDCLDSRTGKRHWTHDAESSILTSPLIVDGKAYVATTDGHILVLALSREKKVLAVNDMDGPVHASPVFANGVLFIATDRKLYAVVKEAAKKENR